MYLYLTQPYDSQSKFSSRIWQTIVRASVAYNPVDQNICIYPIYPSVTQLFKIIGPLKKSLRIKS